MFVKYFALIFSFFLFIPFSKGQKKKESLVNICVRDATTGDSLQAILFIPNNCVGTATNINSCAYLEISGISSYPMHCLVSAKGYKTKKINVLSEKHVIVYLEKLPPNYKKQKVISYKDREYPLNICVKDAKTKEPIPGSALIIRGKEPGASTNFDGCGCFEVSLPYPYMLYVSVYGYKTKEVEVLSEELIITYLEKFNKRHIKKMERQLKRRSKSEKRKHRRLE